jgi:hypothetical protein
MKKLVIAMAIVLGLNVIGSMASTISSMSYAQESPDPGKPEPEKPKPDTD